MKNSIKKSLSLLLCSVLITAMALTTTACNGNNTSSANTQSSTTSEIEAPADSSEATSSENASSDDASSDAQTSQSTEVKELGEGKNSFTFIVVDADKNETTFKINTDKTIIGEALQELGLIAGDESEYGLYVKTVNGITADYDKDKTYWAFYIDGAYASTGVDSTEYKKDSVYSFKVEK